MALSLDLAHLRYVQQAAWTASPRHNLLAQVGLPNAQRVLEVGCGTGAVLQTLPHSPRTTLHGLDIDLSSLFIAKQAAAAALLARGDAHKLPYPSASFDIVFTHFVLLWLVEPAAALLEMRRVTRRRGAVLALAEPDYSKRFDQPERLAKLGRLQTEALRSQGADPEIGGRLHELFEQAGFTDVESGEFQKNETSVSATDWELEQSTLRADLAGSMPSADLERVLAEDRLAWQHGERVLHIPTFYALGRVP